MTYLTVNQIVERYGLDRNTVLKAIASERIPPADCYKVKFQNSGRWYVCANRVQELWGDRLVTIPVGMGYCRHCKQVKPLGEFPTKRLCRPCRSAEAASYYRRKERQP